MALFTDVVQGVGYTTAAVANKVALPNLTLPASARMITRIWVTACITDFNVAEPLVGYVRVTSEDCGIAPLQIPLEPVPGFITVAASVQREPHKWIVNCPCPGSTTLSFDVVGDVGQSVAPEVQVTVEFTDGSTPFGSGQLHMKVGEPPATLGTADNVAISLDDIEIKASQLHMVFGYAIQLQPTADESCPTTVEVKSDDFREHGPFRFAWNPHGAGIANSASGGVDLTIIETDRSFKVPGQKQTLSCITTTRDAMAGNGRANWGVVYS